MKDITVRLYKLHDYDLIYLYKNMRFPIKNAMLMALKAYIRNEPVFIDFPISYLEDDKLVKIKSAQFHIKLDEKSDADIIEYLSNIKKFYRNSFLKNLLRGYLAGPAAYTYEIAPNEQTFDRINNIQNNILKIKELPLMKKRKIYEKKVEE